MDLLTRLYLPFALPIIMATVGLSLSFTDLRRALLRPKALSCGLAGQVVVLPVAAFSLAAVFPVEPTTAVGLVIIAASPGSPLSNYLTHVSKGDTMLSIVVTVASSLIGVVTLPIIVRFAIDLFLPETASINLPLASAVMSLIGFTMLPVMLGMTIRHFSPRLTRMLQRAVEPLSLMLFAGVLGAVLYAERDNLVGYFREAGTIVTVLNVVMMAVGYLMAKLARLPPGQRIAISLEVGLQNATMAIFIALSLLGRMDLVVPAAAYRIIMLFTSSAFAGLMRWRMTKSARHQEVAPAGLA